MKLKPIFSFVGSSGSGKTTFVEKLIPVLINKNIRIGVIKHDAHKFEIDKPGKDSFRFKAAGSEIVAISSPEKMGLVKSFTDKELSLEEIVIRYFGDIDLVITEGYKKSSIPKIEVFRKENSKPHLNLSPSEMIAIISDEEAVYDVPRFNFSDVEDVAEHIVRLSDFSSCSIEVCGIEDQNLLSALRSVILGGRFISSYSDNMEIKIVYKKNGDSNEQQ